jgi:hypothetical protein
MNDYYPVFTNVSKDVSERWERIRKFLETWHTLEIPRLDYANELENIEADLGVQLPTSFKNYITLSKQLLSMNTSYPNGYETNAFSRVFRDYFEIKLLEEHRAISMLLQAEGDFYWAVKKTDLHVEDPAVHGYLLDYDSLTSNKFDHFGHLYSSLTSFVLVHLFTYLQKVDGSGFGALIEHKQAALALLEDCFASHATVDGVDIFESKNMLAFLHEDPFEELERYTLGVHLRKAVDKATLHKNVWELSTKAGWVYGAFAERSRAP